MVTPLPTYRPSGAPGAATAGWVLAAAAALAAGSWLYVGLLRWVPWIQVCMLVSFAFAGATGGLAWWAMRKGPCRSRLAGALSGLALAAVALGGSYGWAWHHTLSRVAAENPGVSVKEVAGQITFQRWVEVRVQKGWQVTRHGSQSDFSGWVVWTVWAVEALLVLAAALFGADAAASSTFCERCQDWTEPRTLLLPGRTRADVQAALEGGDLSAVVALPELPPGERPAAAGTKADPARTLSLHGDLCPRCRESGWLTVAELRTWEEKGKTQRGADRLAGRVALEGGQVQVLLDRLVSRALG